MTYEPTGLLHTDMRWVISGFVDFGPGACWVVDAMKDAEKRASYDARSLSLLDAVMSHAPTHVHQVEPSEKYVALLLWLGYRTWLGGGALQIGPYIINAEPIVDASRPVVIDRMLIHIPSLN